MLKLTFDNEDELYKIKTHFPDAQLVIRILTDDSKSTAALGKKFGAASHRIPALLHTAKTLDLNVIGVSFHVGSGNYSADAFREAVTRSYNVFQLAQDAGYTFTLLDLGGGFPGVDGGIVSFEEIAHVLTDVLDTYFPSGGGVRIIAEPGRYYVTTSHHLAVSVIGRRVLKDNSPAVHVDENDSGVDTADGMPLSPTSPTHRPREAMYMYYLSDGVYGALNCTMLDNVCVEPFILSRSKPNPRFSDPPHLCSIDMHMSTLWGPTCDSIDCVATDILLPELHIGDWLVMQDMGAYTKGSSTRFNGMELAKCFYINTEQDTALAVRVATGELTGVPVCQADLFDSFHVPLLA